MELGLAGGVWAATILIPAFVASAIFLHVTTRLVRRASRDTPPTPGTRISATSIIVGAPGVCLCWIPLLGLLGLPFLVFGVALAIVGFTSELAQLRVTSLSALGLIVNVGALVMMTWLQRGVGA